jgi:hypothetical protein
MSLNLDPLSGRRGIDLDKLKVRFPALYRSVTLYNHAVTKTGQETGICNVDLGIFPEESRKYILECATPLPDIAAPTPAEPTPAEPTEPQISMAELEAELQADMQRRADEAAARNEEAARAEAARVAAAPPSEPAQVLLNMKCGTACSWSNGKGSPPICQCGAFTGQAQESFFGAPAEALRIRSMPSR